MFAPGLLVVRRPKLDKALKVSYATNYWVGDYSVYAFNYSAWNLPLGTAHDAWIIVRPAKWPSGVEFHWMVPEGTVANGLGVWGYHHLDESLNDANFPPTIKPPVMVADLLDGSFEFDWSFEGSPYFGLLHETWLTQKPRSKGDGTSQQWFDASTTSGSATVTAIASAGAISHMYPGCLIEGAGIPAGARVRSVAGATITMSANATATAGNASLSYRPSLWEVGLLYHIQDKGFVHGDGTLIGPGMVMDGVTYMVRRHDRYITLSPAAGQATPFVIRGSWATVYAYLLEHGVINGSEFMNGQSIGPEPNFKAGTGTHSGVSKLSHVKFTRTGSGAYNIDYLGTNALGNGSGFAGWSMTGVTLVAAQPDINGGTRAVFLSETPANQTHTTNADWPWLVLPNRAVDVTYALDVRITKGRSDLKVTLANPADWTTQLSVRFDLLALSSVTDLAIGGLSLLSAEVIDLGNDWRRVFIKFRKATGFAAAFVQLSIMNGVNDTYLGEAAKGLIVDRYRFVQDTKLIYTGTPGNGTLYASYVHAPTLRGGAGNVTVTVTQGTLPAGLLLNAGTGQITGTPTELGASNGIILTATDAEGRTAAIGPFNIVVGEPANLAQTNLSNASVIKTAATVTNANTATQGFLETATNAQHNVSQTVTGQSASAGQYRAEFNVGAIGGRSHCHIYLAQANDAANAIVILDLAGGTIAQATYTGLAAAAAATIAPNGDGTFKVVIRITWPAAQTTIKWRVQSMSSSGTFSFLGETTKGVMLRNDYKLQRVG